MTPPTAASRRTSSRRRRAHDATVEEIRDAARALLTEEGAGGLTVSAVARRLGIVPSGLYRYYNGRDDLLAALAADVWDELADRLRGAADDGAGRSATERLRRVAHAWREWALSEPAAFALVFGAPSQTPYTETVVAAADRAGLVFGRLIVEALEGRAASTELLVPDALRAPLARTTGDPGVGAVIVSGRIRLQGHITAEVFGHLPDIAPELRTDLYDFTVSLLLREAGLD